MAATVIDDARRREDLQHAIVGAPLALAELVSTYRRLHGEPAQDSAALACSVGRVLGLDDVALLELRLAATLQHVGRLLLDGDDDEECAEAEAVAAADVLAGIAGLEVVAIVVRHRAEAWSGRGGPDGLAGERIPLASRILAVCRAYERLGDAPEASSALWGEGGGRFDPVVVGALAEVVDPIGSGSTRKFLRAWGRGDLTFAC
jgi:HD-GYP domain-containing protein (c-di-GMP phosphodiesterase class II)